MAYLHCHKCNWSQDDFYHTGYNPAKYLMDWNESLFGDNHHKLDEPFTDDSQFISEYGNITLREVLALEYEKFANRIRKMKWVTDADFKADFAAGIAKCPKCGSMEDFDID